MRSQKSMNLSLIEIALIWLIFPSALIAIIAVASYIHEEFLSTRKHTESALTMPPVSITASPERATQQEVAFWQRTIERGYDSPELFREDLWLIRIDRSRKAYTKSIALKPFLNVDAGDPAESAKSICAFLAQHPGSRCDN
jgi:hypothetical protein